MSEPHDQLVTLWTSASDAERRDALLHVRDCTACQAGASKLGLALDALEGGTVGRVPVPAPAGGLAKLLARARTGRLDYFIPELMKLFDVDEAVAKAALARVERNDWEEGPGPGVGLIGVNAGPRIKGALTALVKLEPGATFPHHPHPGDEEVLVLEGGYRDSHGVEVWRGEVQPMAAGTSHSFTAFADVGCICASRVVVDDD